MSGRNDIALLEAIKANNNSKYIELMYVRIFPKIKKIVFDGRGNHEDAKDLLHDTVLAFFKYVKENKYELNTDIDAFLYTVAKNRWINKAVKDKRLEISDQNFEHSMVEPSHIGKLYSKERVLAVRTILDRLGDRCKELLTMIYYDEKSMKEIGEEMGYATADAVKTKHYKCKQRMISMVKENSTYKELLTTI
jgi:RNA polymerase sigma factor (sigma-70 family)